MKKIIIFTTTFAIIILSGVFIFNFVGTEMLGRVLQTPTQQIIAPGSTSTSFTQKSFSANFSQNFVVNSVQVSFIAGNSTYKAFVKDGSSVFDAMNILASTTSFIFNAKYYSGLGFFVNQINGVKNANGYYWTLYINGVYSTVGASQYYLKDGDKVEWKFEKK